ncbi:hypothetical protein AB0M94_33305 [Streptomyces xanthochromogenes]|uniref:Uncharacterized protein n=1 Tax=Streptomyces xanthochromogenes TaxID=67384 RepID=A0ABQ3AAL4_9ACTN|nr:MULTISPECIES: hypothetical protein [Streptomyces]MYV95493.1 hypothetical protein [Streptomyces sp. SID1034]GGY43672.1 hypothetical protein GCM10010326_42540 [Streptomyces xanthochromogenes]
MLERVYRKLVLLLPERPDTAIPLQVIAQTAVVGILAVTARWASVLVTATVAGVVWMGLPPEALVMAAPMAWADRTVVIYLRVTRL